MRTCNFYLHKCTHAQNDAKRNSYTALRLLRKTINYQMEN